MNDKPVVLETGKRFHEFYKDLVMPLTDDGDVMELLICVNSQDKIHSLF